MEWFSIDIEDTLSVKQLAQYLRQNKVKYETSDLDGHGKHFEIYCDNVMANKIDTALDRIFDHIADKAESSLTEDADYSEKFVKNMKNNRMYKRVEQIAADFGFELMEAYVEVANEGNERIICNLKDNLSYSVNVYFNEQFYIDIDKAVSLNLREAEHFRDHINKAVDMVEKLDKLDLSRLYNYKQ